MSEAGQDPLLSQEETDALLDAMRAGNEGPASADPIDLTAPDRPLRAALAHADRTAEAFVRAAPKCFLRTLGCATRVEEEPCEIVPFSVLSTALQPGSAVAPLKTRDGSLAILVMGPTLVSLVLDRQMGAPLLTESEDGKSVPTDDLSNVDRRVLAPFVRDLAETFSEQWNTEPSAFVLDEVLARPSDMPRLAQFEPLLRVAVRAVPNAAPGDEILFALTAQAVVGTVPAAVADQAASSPQDRDLILSRVTATDVECVSVLGAARSTVRDLIALSTNDVVRLDSVPGEPLPLCVGDAVVGNGMPVVLHGNLALEITETQ